MIRFECPKCKTKISVKDEHAGKRGRCPECKSAIQVPDPDVFDDLVEDIESSASLEQSDTAIPPKSSEPNNGSYNLTPEPIQMKDCPYCGEEIQSVAKKCKHCGEWLDHSGSNNRPVARAPSQGEPTCPNCGCTQFQITKKGYSADTGCCMAILLGPLGLLCGLMGSKVTSSVCVKCGHDMVLPTASNIISLIIQLIFWGAILYFILIVL
jgi:predicted Zn finger-like uncharacterized protein